MKPISVHAPAANTFSLKGALLVYENRHGGAYVSAHQLLRSGPALALGAGHPLERQELRRLLHHTGRDLGLKGWVSAEILYIAPDAIAWWRPPAPAPVFFATGSLGRKARQGVPPHPGLVFAVAGRRWFVWAVRGVARPAADTPLLQAPYFNVYEDGAICEGNVRVPKVLAPETTAAFERAFFESRFTHANAPQLCTYDGGGKALWRALLDGAYCEFPDCLIPTNTTLGAALKRIAREEHDDDA